MASVICCQWNSLLPLFSCSSNSLVPQLCLSASSVPEGDSQLSYQPSKSTVLPKEAVWHVPTNKQATT